MALFGDLQRRPFVVHDEMFTRQLTQPNIKNAFGDFVVLSKPHFVKGSVFFKSEEQPARLGTEI